MSSKEELIDISSDEIMKTSEKLGIDKNILRIQSIDNVPTNVLIISRIKINQRKNIN